MAVTGLPNPDEQHAVHMSRFAYQCLVGMKELIRELEAILGPGTSDLSLRVGLHSGPVTAGVLRGEKSRCVRESRFFVVTSTVVCFELTKSLSFLISHSLQVPTLW